MLCGRLEVLEYNNSFRLHHSGNLFQHEVMSTFIICDHDPSHGIVLDLRPSREGSLKRSLGYGD